MDYEQGLDGLKRLAQDKEWYHDFTLHEAALRDNLRDERRYGPSEQTRRDRTRIVDQLNALVLTHLNVSFNDLCLGKTPPVPVQTAAQPAAEPTAAGQSPETAADRYDVFISYSTSDRDWVSGELLPQLEQAGLKAIIDYRDFEIGTPTLINIERAVDRSRHTLLVMTPNWLNSAWTEFESLLVGSSDPGARRRKLIPLLLERCDIPPRIRMLTYADFTQPARRVVEMERLVRGLAQRQDA